MNEENIKRMESRLARAYKEGHYKEDLEKMQNYELLATLDNICDVVGSVEWLKKEEEANK